MPCVLQLIFITFGMDLTTSLPTLPLTFSPVSASAAQTKPWSSKLFFVSVLARFQSLRNAQPCLSSPFRQQRWLSHVPFWSGQSGIWAFCAGNRLKKSDIRCSTNIYDVRPVFLLKPSGGWRHLRHRTRHLTSFSWFSLQGFKMSFKLFLSTEKLLLSLHRICLATSSTSYTLMDPTRREFHTHFPFIGLLLLDQ